MKVSRYQIKPLNRQAEEASKIKEFNGLKYLNRRGEWGQNLPPKLSLEENLDPKTGTKRKGFRSMKSVEPIEATEGLKSAETNVQNEAEVYNNTKESQDVQKITPTAAQNLEKNAPKSPPKKRSKTEKKCPVRVIDAPPPMRSKSLTVKQIILKMKSGSFGGGYDNV